MTVERTKSRREIVEILVERDGYACYLCDDPYDETDGPTIEHVIPLARGGTWDMDNLKLAHRLCNQRKGDRMFDEDGVLEARDRKVGYRERHANKQAILEAFCDLCYDGRLLLPTEECDSCGREAKAFPWTLKKQPKECDHSKFWCWACSIGLYERRPALMNILTGEDR
jgi:HNH endonuclease